MWPSHKKLMVGKVIKACSWSPGGLTLHCADRDYVFDCEAECCSESWIEHLTEPKYPATIIEVEEKDLPNPPQSGRQEYDQAYSTVFKTDQGLLEIEYRNSSNGYYGGRINLQGFDYDGKPRQY